MHLLIYLLHPLFLITLFITDPPSMEMLRCGVREGEKDREGEGHISYYGSVQEVGGGLAGDLHGLGPGLVVQGPGGAALQQAVEVVAAATAVHGGDAGRGGCARASQTSHSC